MTTTPEGKGDPRRGASLNPRTFTTTRNWDGELAAWSEWCQAQKKLPKDQRDPGREKPVTCPQFPVRMQSAVELWGTPCQLHWKAAAGWGAGTAASVLLKLPGMGLIQEAKRLAKERGTPQDRAELKTFTFKFATTKLEGADRQQLYVTVAHLKSLAAVAEILDLPLGQIVIPLALLIPLTGSQVVRGDFRTSMQRDLEHFLVEFATFVAKVERQLPFLRSLPKVPGIETGLDLALARHGGSQR